MRYIVVFCMLGTMGCSHDQRWDRHMHDHWPHHYKYREPYGHAYLGPELSRRARMDAQSAETPPIHD
jgi:hypothetical protein